MIIFDQNDELWANGTYNHSHSMFILCRMKVILRYQKFIPVISSVCLLLAHIWSKCCSHSSKGKLRIYGKGAEVFRGPSFSPILRAVGFFHTPAGGASFLPTRGGIVFSRHVFLKVYKLSFYIIRGFKTFYFSIVS